MKGQELRTIIHIEALQLKGQVSFEIFELSQHVGGSFVPDGAVLSPLAENVRKRYAPDETARHGCATVRDGVGLQESRTINVPIVCANGDLNLEEPTWPSATETFAWVACSRFFEQPINRGRADPQQLLSHRVSQRSVFVFIERQPQRQRRLQALGTHLLGFEPKEFERLKNLAVVAPARTWPFAPLAGFTAQQPDRILARVAAD